MNRRHALLLLAGGLAVILTAQVLNHFQVQASGRKALVAAWSARYFQPDRELRQALEQGMGFGKPLATFQGADRIFKDICARHEGIGWIAFSSPGGEVWGQYSGTGPVPDIMGQLDRDALPRFPLREPEDSFGLGKTVEVADLVLVTVPLYFDGRLEGIAWTGFSRESVDAPSREAAGEGAWMLLWEILGGIVIFLGGFRLLVIPPGRRNSGALSAGGETEDQGLSEKAVTTRVTGLILVILVAGLGIYTGIAAVRALPVLNRAYHENVRLLARAQAGELERLAAWGIPVESWKSLPAWLAPRVRSGNGVADLVVRDKSGQPAFLVTPDHTWSRKDDGGDLPAEPKADVQVTIPGPGGGSAALMELSLDQGFFDGILLERILDALTLSVVSLVFGAELLLALGLLARPRNRALAQPSMDSERGIRTIRFTAFLFFMAELLPLSFMPLYITDLYARAPLLIFQLGADTVKSLPFSVHLLGVMICIPLVGTLASRFSMRRIFLVTGLLLLTGNILASLVPDLALLMLCRFVSGLGYGGVLAASGGLVVQTTDKEHRTRGFASWGAGFAAASICAVVLGGTLVAYVGYRGGLVISALLSVVMGLFVVFSHPRRPPAPEDLPDRVSRIGDLFAVFKDRNALMTLLFASLPVQLAFFGLFQYTLPLVMHQAGLSEANIGRILTIYGLSSLAAPVLARFADRTHRERVLIGIGNLITGLVLTLLFFRHSTLALVFVVAAIGIGGLMFDTCISAFLTMTRMSATLGDTRFLSIFLTWEKLFTIFIPILVGFLMGSLGYLESAGVMGILITAGSVIFLVFVRTPREARTS